MIKLSLQHQNINIQVLRKVIKCSVNSKLILGKSNFAIDTVSEQRITKLNHEKMCCEIQASTMHNMLLQPLTFNKFLYKKSVKNDIFSTNLSYFPMVCNYLLSTYLPFL